MRPRSFRVFLGLLLLKRCLNSLFSPVSSSAQCKTKAQCLRLNDTYRSKIGFQTLTLFWWLWSEPNNEQLQLTTENTFVYLNDFIVLIYFFFLNSKTQVTFLLRLQQPKNMRTNNVYSIPCIHGWTVACWPFNLIGATSPQSRTITVFLIQDEECLTVNSSPSFDSVRRKVSVSYVFCCIAAEEWKPDSTEYKS